MRIAAILTGLRLAAARELGRRFYKLRPVQKLFRKAKRVFRVLILSLHRASTIPTVETPRRLTTRRLDDEMTGRQRSIHVDFHKFLFFIRNFNSSFSSLDYFKFKCFYFHISHQYLLTRSSCRNLQIVLSPDLAGLASFKK